MPGSTRALRAKDLRHVWHPFTQMQAYQTENAPIFVGGEGVYLIDSEGRRIYDAISSVWLNVHGHRHPALDAALKAQIDRLAHATLLGASNPPAIELAARLAELAPGGLGRVFYSEDGAEAVEIALKMAFQYWQHRGEPRRLFVSMENAYHGDTLGAVSVGAIPRFHEVFRPLLFETLRVPYPSRPRPGAETVDAGACLAQLEALLSARAREIAALIVEPLVQGAGGMVMMPDGFMPALAALCRRYGILWIADEVATGFGRTGAMFACTREGVVPDLMALGKGLTGGYLPLAATLASEEVYAAFLAGPDEPDRTFYHGHSYTGNPLACAVALASLELFERGDLIAKVQADAAWLDGELAALKALPHVGDVRRCGLIAAIDLLADARAGRPYAAGLRMGKRVARRLLELGAFTRPLGDTLVFMPPLCSTRPEMRAMLALYAQAIREVCGDGAEAGGSHTEATQAERAEP